MAPAFVGQITFPGARPGQRPRTTAGEGQGFTAAGRRLLLGGSRARQPLAAPATLRRSRAVRLEKMPVQRPATAAVTGFGRHCLISLKTIPSGIFKFLKRKLCWQRPAPLLQGQVRFPCATGVLGSVPVRERPADTNGTLPSQADIVQTPCGRKRPRHVAKPSPGVESQPSGRLFRTEASETGLQACIGGPGPGRPPPAGLA